MAVGETTPEFTAPVCTPRNAQQGAAQFPTGLLWQGQGPPTVSARESRPTLSQYFVPLLLHAAGLLEDQAARAWEGVPWFRASRAAFGHQLPVSVAELLSAIDRQTRAGATLTPDAALRRLRAVAPTQGGIMLPVAVAALVSDNHYLAASSQETLLIRFAGEAAASRISAGAAALIAPPIPVADATSVRRQLPALMHMCRTLLGSLLALADVGGGSRASRTLATARRMAGESARGGYATRHRQRPGSTRGGRQCAAQPAAGFTCRTTCTVAPDARH